MKNNGQEERSPGADRIVQIATALFAEHGFHGVSTREIAAATGLSVATVHHHVGSKRELYLKVYKSLLDAAESFFHDIVAQVETADLQDPQVRAQLPTKLIDSFVDLVARNPVWSRLFVRQWLDKPEELMNVEADLSLPLYRKLHEMLLVAQEAGIIHLTADPWLLMRSVEWLVYGYFTAGTFYWDQWRSDPLAEGNLNRFKAFMREYIFRMLNVAPADMISASLNHPD